MRSIASLKPRYLLIVSASIEVGTGLTLAIAPAVLVTLLLGAGIETPAGWVVARLAGSALVALGTACWLARNDEQSQSTRGIMVAMLIYNAAAAALLAGAGMASGLSGPALWPAVLLHAALAMWCTACLWAFQPSRS